MKTPSRLLSRITALFVLLLIPGIIHAQGWRLVGISGMQGNEDDDPPGSGNYIHPDWTLFQIDHSNGSINKLFQVTFAHDSQCIGFCPANGLIYRSGGAESYSNNPQRFGGNQGDFDFFGLGFQDSQYLESVNLETQELIPVYNADPCPNPDQGGDDGIALPCFGLDAPRPTWVLPVERRDSTQTGSAFRTRGENEYHAIRGMAWSTSSNLFYIADEHGIFKLTTDGDCKFLARPAFPIDGAADESKAIAFVTLKKLLVGHRNMGYIMEIDPETGDVLGELALMYPEGGGEPLDQFGGVLGLAQHPETGVLYGIRQTSDVYARELVTIDLVTGATRLVGNMGMHITSIAFVPSPWRLIGISGMQGNEDDDPPGSGNYIHPDWTLFQIDLETAAVTKLFQPTFAHDSQCVGFCPTNGLIYRSGGAESYSNNPQRFGGNQGDFDFVGLGFQDSQYLEAINLANQELTPIYNANPCPNPDMGGDDGIALPCFGLDAPRPTWVLPVERRDSTQTGSEFRARGENEYHAIRGMAWSTDKNLFYIADEHGIFKLTTDGDCKFLARPAFPVDGAPDESKAIAFVTLEKLLVGHRNKGYMMEIDPVTGDVLSEVALAYPEGGGEPVDDFGGLLGLVQHPETGVLYGIRKTSDNYARELVTINPVLGATLPTTLVGNMGMHITSIAFVPTPPLRIKSIVRNGNNVTITWTGGTGPFTLQKKTMLSDANWVDVAMTSLREATVPIEGTTGFFRVADQVRFQVTLNGASERPTPVDTPGMGSGTLVLDGNKLTVNITYSGLLANANNAHIHGPATVDQFAGVLQGLNNLHVGPFSTSGTFSGSVTLNSATVNHMLNELTYVNIHSTMHPGGEIRGQVVRISP